MSEGDTRPDWGEKHRMHIQLLILIFAGVVLIGSIPLAMFTEGIPQYFGVGLGSIAAFQLFPSARPFLSDLVDRLPFLKSKNGAKEIEG